MLAQAQLAAPRLRAIGSDREREGRGNLHRHRQDRQVRTMNAWHPTRVLTAAEFIGRSLRVGVLTLRRGGLTLLELSVAPAQQGNPTIDRWRYGSRSRYPADPPVWPLENVDPWEQASYSGPLPDNLTVGPEQPCPSCGTLPPDAQANYCHRCGTPISIAENSFAIRIARVVSDIAAGAPSAGGDVAALIDDYTPRAPHGDQGRAELIEFIAADFADLATARFARGAPASISPHLTLAAAQEIQQTVATEGQVRPEQIPQAELVLRFAPLQFGYWGPFKALVKSFPVDEMPDAYGDAIARISSKDWSRPAPPSVHVEDIGFLNQFSSAASPKTLAYLSRRARRDLADLARRSPGTYAHVASRLILSWDRGLSSSAFTPAYVMLGARSSLDTHSKYVDLEADMSTRRDPHPEIWNSRPEMAQRIFDTIRSSVEAHTWSYQVLESVSRAPGITERNLHLALLSTYLPLSGTALEAVSRRPGVWDTLTTEHWSTLFKKDDDATVDAILDAMFVGTLRPAAVDAARDFLASANTAAQSRRLRVALLLLSAIGRTEGDLLANSESASAAVAAVITETDTEHRKLWYPVLERMDLDGLERVLREIPEDDRHQSAIQAVNEVLLPKKAANASPYELIDWIASADPMKVTLGWATPQIANGLTWLWKVLPEWISHHRHDPTRIERVTSQLIEHAGPDDVTNLQQIALVALDAGAITPSVAALMSNTSPTVLWQVLTRPSGGSVASLSEASPALIQRIGDSIGPKQIKSASPTQLELALRYIEANPARIERDVDFGVAAAVSEDPDLREMAIAQLQLNNYMPLVWTALADSLVPSAQMTALNYIASLTDPHKFKAAVEKLLDSRVPTLRDSGLRLLGELQQGHDRSTFWAALAESNNKQVVELVATRALASDSLDRQMFFDFARRILTTPGRNRRAREAVKAHLENAKIDSPESIALLLELARGQNVRDREWALRKLAELALLDVAIEGIEVSLVTNQDNS